MLRFEVREKAGMGEGGIETLKGHMRMLEGDSG